MVLFPHMKNEVKEQANIIHDNHINDFLVGIDDSSYIGSQNSQQFDRNVMARDDIAFLLYGNGIDAPGASGLKRAHAS